MDQDIPAGTREKVIAAIRIASDRFSVDRTAQPDEQELADAVAAACDEVGISPQEYRTVIDASDELTELEHEAMGEARFGVADPGPYAAISRESPSGKAGDTTKNREHSPLKG